MTALLPRLLLAALAALPALGPAQASRVGPSFDCARAGTVSERTICASTFLPALDRRVAAAYAEARRELGGALGEWLEEALRGDQIAWLRRRDRCGADVACLAREMERRAETLSFRASGAGPPSGRFTYREASGRASVLRLSASRALARIVTSHPGDARWMCDVAGPVTREGGRWVLRGGDGRALAELRPRGADGLTVAALPPSGAPSSEVCGLNGTFTGEYTRLSRP